MPSVYEEDVIPWGTWKTTENYFGALSVSYTNGAIVQKQKKKEGTWKNNNTKLRKRERRSRWCRLQCANPKAVFWCVFTKRTGLLWKILETLKGHCGSESDVPLFSTPHQFLTLVMPISYGHICKSRPGEEKPRCTVMIQNNETDALRRPSFMVLLTPYCTPQVFNMKNV